MPVLLPGDWFNSGLAAQVCRSVNLAASLLLSAFHVGLTQDSKRPTSGQVYVEWKVPCLLICMVRLTFQSCTRFTLCVVRERNAKRNNNKIYGVKRWLCHSYTEYVLYENQEYMVA